MKTGLIEIKELNEISEYISIGTEIIDITFFMGGREELEDKICVSVFFSKEKRG